MSFVSGIFAQNVQVPEGITKVTSVQGVTEYRLENGLQILLIPDQTKQNVTANIVYKVGSRHEGYGETGMAHLLEHLLFKGTPKYGNIPGEISKRGMSANATTSFDRTNYYATFAATGDNLEFYLDMEADRMINSYVAKKDLDSEMTVVRNEMENGENDAQRILIQKVFSSAFQWHNYGKSTIGARSDVENVKIENLQAFYHKYYQPDNAALIVAGKFDQSKVLSLIKEKFGAISKPGRILNPTWTTEPTQDGERAIYVRRTGTQQMIMVGYHIPQSTNADFPAIYIMERLLADSAFGELHKNLVETKMATSVLGGSFQLREPGFIIFAARVAKDKPLDVVQSKLIETVEDFGQKLPAKEDVERQKLATEKGLSTVMGDSTTLASIMSEWVSKGDWRLAFSYREGISKVTPEDVQRVAKTYFLSSNRTMGIFVPTDNPIRADIPVLTEEQIAARGNTVKAGETISAGEAFEATTANIEARTTRGQIGGIKTAFLAKQNRGDLVRLRLDLHFGDEKSLKNLDKVGELTGGLLMRGTQKRTRQQIKEDTDRMKVSVSVNGSATGVSVVISAKKDTLAEALRIAAEILKEPAFLQTDFEEVKIAAQTGLENTKGNPASVAQRELRIAFNQKKKGEIGYVGTVDEDIAETKAVTLEQVKKFHRDFYGASNGELVIVGDFDEKEINPVVNQLFGGWKSVKPYTRISQKFAPVSAVKKSIETPDKANAVFYARLPLQMSDSNPDYPAMLMGNFIFGGGFLNSRLATRIRQKEGISYSIGSMFSAGSRDDSALFMVQGIFAPENAERLENALREEIEKVLRDGFTEKEVAEAKQGWILSRQRIRGDDTGLRSLLVAQLIANRTMAWEDEMEKKLQL